MNVQACACDSLTYYHKIFIFAVSERWLTYDCETECSFVYLIVINTNLHRFQVLADYLSNFR